MAEAGVSVILNACAGTGCTPDVVAQLHAGLAAAGMAAQVHNLAQGAQLADAVKQALRAGAHTVVAGGGDGTISAVASALVGSNTALGVLPLGTLNHFAKDLGIPLALDAAIACIAAGHRRAVDTAEVNGRVFINNSSLGLYPDIVRERTHRQHRLGHGKWRALFDASLNAARRYPVLNVEIEMEGRVMARRTPFVFVGNNVYTMEGFQIGERRALDCGQLSLYLTQRIGRFGLLRLAVMALLRRLRQASDFDMLQARRFTVHTRRKHLRVATDGEISMMDTPLHYRVRPASLQVIVPAPRMAEDANT